MKPRVFDSSIVRSAQETVDFIANIANIANILKFSTEQRCRRERPRRRNRLWNEVASRVRVWAEGGPRQN
jgi:hypothetical protein